MTLNINFVLSVSVLAVLFMPTAWAQSSSSRLGVVIEAKNITLPAGTRAALPCHSARMVWTQDRLRDRQRVVHWDVVRTSPEYSVERILDMSPGANQRVYNGFNKGRISIPSSAFIDGNFSLVFNNVVASDRGVYTCNLHHHYCQLHQSIQIQLNVTKSVRKEKRLWDGEKTVFVVLLGSSVALPCVNRRPLWRDGLQEDQQQVAHWDFQAPGVRPDKAERLVDLYASGERREYGPLFLQNKMSVEEDAFSMGDFSLTIADLAPVDKGLYSCHLTHHYCGLHERRIFRLTVGPPLPPRDDDHLTEAPLVIPKETSIPRTDEVERPRVVNVILPEHGGHSTLQLGYVLATFLLLAFIVATVVLLTRRRRKRGLEYELRRSERGHVINGDDIPLDSTELKACNLEPLTSDYKNNILKERDMSKGCNIDFDEKLWK